MLKEGMETPSVCMTVFANISIKSKSSEYFLHLCRTHFAIELALRFYTCKQPNSNAL